MDKDLARWIGLGVGIVGVVAAASSFSSKLNKVERTGLTLTGCAALVLAGYVLLNRIEDTAEQAARLV
jgi:hypothetical protein